MAEGVVLFGVQKLWELLSRESERFQGVHEQVSELQRQLGRLQSLLNDADAKKHDSGRVRNFLDDVKDIVYDAEDITETFLLNEERAKVKGIKESMRRLACFLPDRRKFDSDIKGITMRISDVIGEMQSVGILQIIDGGGSLLPLQHRQREIRQTFPKNSETDLVGVEKSVEDLVERLVGNNNIQVVSISGMGGIGKTTLARQVFHHDMHDSDVLGMDKHTLQCKLFELLETGRYLIVLDDVWNVEDWDRIKAVFPQNGGWKILLTSRNEGLHADPTCSFFRLRSLTHEQSWTLCRRIAFPSRDTTESMAVEEMEAMGKKMVTNCGGLPLAVKVLGGLLAGKHSIPEWEKVYENIGPNIVGGSGLDNKNLNSVYRVLCLSYEDLPVCLKHCFLSLACFPEDYRVNVETLFSYWAAEGITTLYLGGATIRDSAEGCLEVFIRCESPSIVKVTTYTIHCF
ncbi:unnamed protein product [Microthlaspi erraticum]|uniref:NB-ARC domain-containing protein n=1 Tax=Microthlaspi erraticum TaxID=1685480 RepID=A0A6D2L975_9BRAS|nr:unnamed protein product [Microthlaspi erraticum]